MKQKSIYERYSIKQKINVTRQSEIMQTLNSELKKSRELSLQLDQIAKQTEIKPGETNAIFLRSSCWYGNKVQEQLETAKNRNAFLEKEVNNSRKLLAKAVNKKKKSLDLWNQYEATKNREKEEKIDEELSSRKRVSKFSK